MKIRTGGPDDAAATLDLLDAAVAWLAADGRTGQWGDRPWTSRPASVERIHRYTAEYLLRAAEDASGRTIGVCLLSETSPDYAAPLDERELYVRLLVTDRALAGSGIGAALVADAAALARSRGIGLLRLDCYAGDDRRLVAHYERLGFTPTEPFEVDHPDGLWPGQLLTMRV
ncbi:GCN5 family N-acetyltransferase [Kitasatospora sp. NE20-6]|uniref:GNAT family N-acetyltransferase n=1 Tax=Kitasatospora sp. NE20-6 TaxID=2859066 RepID=UPI0034DC4A3D